MGGEGEGLCEGGGGGQMVCGGVESVCGVCVCLGGGGGRGFVLHVQVLQCVRVLNVQ